MAINPFNLNKNTSQSTQNLVKNTLANMKPKQNFTFSSSGLAGKTPTSNQGTNTTTQMYKPTTTSGMTSSTSPSPTVITPPKTNTSQQSVQSNSNPAMNSYINTVYPQNNTPLSTPSIQTPVQTNTTQSQVPSGITIGANGQWIGTPTAQNQSKPDAMSAYLAQYSQSIADQNRARLEKADIENKQKEAQVKAYEAYNKKLDESGSLLGGARQAATNIERRAGITDQQFALEKLAASNLLSALSQNQQANQPIQIGDNLIDPRTGAIVYTKPQEGFSLSEGQQRYDAQGNLIAGSTQRGFELGKDQVRYEFDPETGNYRQVATGIQGSDTSGSELLTPTEAQSLGVPYGTTKAQAYGTSTTKPLSGEASKLLSITETVQPEIAQLKNAFLNNYRGSLLGITSGTNRELVKLVDQVADKVGRLRSGGAINTDEANRFKNQIASFMDIPFGNSQQAINALDGILAEAQSVATSIRGSGSGTGTQGGGLFAEEW